MVQPLVIAAIAIAIILFLILVFLLVRQNKSDKYKTDKNVSSEAMGKGLAIGIPIGMGTGIALGTALDNIGLGIALGTAIGISLGIAFGSAFKKKDEESRFLNPRSDSYRTNSKTQLPLILSIIAVLAGMMVLGLIFFLR